MTRNIFHFLPMNAVFEPLGLDVEAKAGLEVEAKVGLEVDGKAGLLEVEAKAGLLEVDPMAGALGNSAKGLAVEAKGLAVDAKGLAVEAKGLAVEAKGLAVEAKGLAVVATGCLTGCLAGLEDSKEPPNNPFPGLGLAVASAGLDEAGLRMGKPLPLNPDPCPLPAPPPKALPFLRADGGTAPDPPQAGTNQGQLHIRFTSSKANPKGHLNS